MRVTSYYKLIIQALLFGLLAWLLVHFFSLFGWFLVLAYPLWWLIFPERKICFLCRLQGAGKNCRHCTRDLKTGHAMGLGTMLLNMVFILIFTGVSALTVYGEYKLINSYFYVAPQTAEFNSSSQKTVYQGKLFPLELVVDGIQRPINAVQLDLSFDPLKLEVVDFISKDSFINIFVEKQIDNTVGFVRVTGGIPSPGYDKEVGLFGNLMIRPKEPGVTVIKILPSSAVLLNDGKGTNIMKSTGEYRYLVLPAEDTMETEDQTKETTFILGAQTQAREDQFIFYEDDGTMEPVKESSQEELSQQTNHWLVEILHSIDSTIIRFITLSF